MVVGAWWADLSISVNLQAYRKVSSVYMAEKHLKMHETSNLVLNGLRLQKNKSGSNPISQELESWAQSQLNWTVEGWKKDDDFFPLICPVWVKASVIFCCCRPSATSSNVWCILCGDVFSAWLYELLQLCMRFRAIWRFSSDLSLWCFYPQNCHSLDDFFSPFWANSRYHCVRKSSFWNTQTSPCGINIHSPITLLHCVVSYKNDQ